MNKIVVIIVLMLASAGTFAQNGVLLELNGTVELRLPGSAEYIPAQTGTVLTDDTIISTGFNSTALIEAGSALLTVRPLSRMTLTEIASAAGTETLNVNLQAGRVRVDLNPPAGTRASMSVSSPVATASVRGTSFEFDTRNLHVRRGTVNFEGRRGMGMRVEAGSSSQLDKDGRASDPVNTFIAGLTPPPPVGTGDTGGSVIQTQAGESFTITIIYPQITD